MRRGRRSGRAMHRPVVETGIAELAVDTAASAGGP